MAESDIPVGSILKMRERGQWVFWRLVECGDGSGKKCITGVDEHLLKGTTIYQSVWKGDRIEPRRVYTLKHDCDYVPIYAQLPDSTAADILQQRSMMSHFGGFMTAAFGGVAGDGGFDAALFPLSAVVRGGHIVTISSVGAVVGRGATYSSAVPVPDDWATMEPAALLAFAEHVVDDFHTQASPWPCMVCHPPMVNKEH